MRRIAVLMVAVSTMGCPVSSPTYCEQYPADPGCGPQTSTNNGGTTTPGGALSCDQPPATYPVQLPVPYLLQQCDELCWAASIDMTARFFGGLVQECDLASYRLRLHGVTYNCCATYTCGDAYCNQGATAGEMASVLGSGLGLNGVLRSGPLTEEELQIELSNNRPVIIGFQGPFNGHAAVVIGFTPGVPATYLVNDPWPTYGQLTATYQQIRQGPNSTPWIWSFYHQSKTSDPCAGR